MKRELAFLMIVLSTGACAQAARPSACNTEQEEYAVLAAILQHSSRKLTVAQQASDDPHFAGTADLSAITRQQEVAQYREQMKVLPEGGVAFLTKARNTTQFPSELISDFQVKNTRVCLWDVNRFKPKQVLTWDTEIEFPRDDPDAWWRKFRRRFGSKASAARISRTGFDSSRRKALVHVSESIGKNAAGGTLYYLEKTGDRWVIKITHDTWTT
jgi:hypothetical protein